MPVAQKDREKVIQEIIVALCALEKCSQQDIDNTKRFLRWMPDDALQDMRDKYMQALEKRTLAHP